MVRRRSLMCPKCGAVNTGGDSYCYSCGEFLGDDFERAHRTEENAGSDGVRRQCSFGEAAIWTAFFAIMLIGGAAFGYYVVADLIAGDDVQESTGPVEDHVGYLSITVARGEALSSLSYSVYLDNEYKGSYGFSEHDGGTTEWTVNWTSSSDTCDMHVRIQSGMYWGIENVVIRSGEWTYSSIYLHS